MIRVLSTVLLLWALAWCAGVFLRAVMENHHRGRGQAHSRGRSWSDRIPTQRHGGRL